MKTYMIYLRLSIFVLMFSTACESVSFKSKKARLEGEWELEMLNETRKYRYSNGSTRLDKYEYDGTTIQKTYNGSMSFHDFNQVLEFGKDGEYKEVIFDPDEIYNNSYSYEGSWQFTLGSKASGQNKREIIMIIRNESESGSGSGSYSSSIKGDHIPFSKIMYLEDVSKDELILSVEYEQNTSSGFKAEVEGEYIFIKK